MADLHGFHALVLPPAARAVVGAFAQQVVEAFDPWRAPLDEAERARRGAVRLDARGQALLERWGYPLTEERFTFHMTLTRALSAGERAAIAPALQAFFQTAVATPAVLDALVVFEEPAPGADFRVIHRAVMG
jgi:hypothetical protein